MGSGERNAQMLVFQESDEGFSMSLFGTLLELGQKKKSEIEGYKERASRMSDRDLMIAARSRSTGFEKSVYLQEVKKRGLEAEFARMLKS